MLEFRFQKLNCIKFLKLYNLEILHLVIISQNELSLDIFRQSISWIEAAVPRYSVELLKISPNSQENTCVGVCFLIKLQVFY